MNDTLVFNWGWYGFNNFGDDLLQQTVFEYLDRAGIRACFPMQMPYECLSAQQVERSYKQLFKQALNCSAIIFGPGGLFPFSNSVKLFIYYSAVLWWKMRRKKVFFLGIGISNKVNRMDILLWKRIIANSDLFFTRSNGFLNSIGVNESEKVKTIADCAFASSILKDYPVSENNMSKRIGIAIASLWDESNIDAAVEIWREVCEHISQNGFLVDLIAFSKEKDDILIKRILDSLKNQDRVSLIYSNEISKAITRWYSYELVICMRFHSLVLSILAGVPALPIAYGLKTVSLADTSGLGKYLVYWNPSERRYFGYTTETEAKTIIDQFWAITQNRDNVITDIKEARECLQKSSVEAMETVVGCID